MASKSMSFVTSNNSLNFVILHTFPGIQCCIFKKLAMILLESYQIIRYNSAMLFQVPQKYQAPDRG